ncbi:MAG TPA: glycosyltransferase family 2 protein [Elusimicrobiota bacterium]|nr:glycosyltransferase family 2 protein [Elusimicrobiota bacterium]
MKKQKLSIILVSYNTLPYVKRCLENVRQRVRRPHEIVCVDNASRDGIAAYMAARPRLKFRRLPENRGFAAAMNEGMRMADGDLFLWLNADALLTEGAVERMIAVLGRRSDVAGVGPCTDIPPLPQGCVPAPRRTADVERVAMAWRLRHAGQVEEVRGLTGFCFLTTRKAVARVGRLDERFYPAGYEDYDFCARALRKGFRFLLAREVFVHHDGRCSYRSRSHWKRIWTENRRRFIAKWGRRFAVPYLAELCS